MKLWCVFMDVSYVSEQSITEISKDGKIVVHTFDNSRDAVTECEQLNKQVGAEILEKLVSQCGYQVERALEIVKSLTPRYFVEEKIE